MTYVNYLIAVSFKVRGDNVDPANVDKVLGILCSRGKKKGEKRGDNPNGRPVFAKTGIWVLDSKIQSKSTPDHLDHMLKLITVTKHELDNAIGFSDAFFDVFVAMNPTQPEESSSLGFRLSTESIARLHHLGFWPRVYTRSCRRVTQPAFG